MPDNGTRRQISSKVSFDSLPVTVSDRAFRTMVGAVGMLFGIVFLAVAALMALVDAQSGKGTVLLPLLVGGASAIWCAYAYGYLAKSVSLTITRDSVTFAMRTHTKWRQWSEPLANYDGVLLETEMRGAGRQKYLVWSIWLQHSQEAKRVLLRRERSEWKAREAHEHFCRVLDLSALESTSEGAVLREVGDMGRSLRLLHGGAKGKTVPDEVGPASAALRVHSTPWETEVTLLGRMPFSIALICVGLAAALWMLVAIVPWGRWLFLLAIIASAGAGYVALICLWELISKPKLRLTNDAIELVRKLPFGEWRVRRIVCADIVAVTITKRIDQISDAVVLRSAHKQIRFGAGLAPAELQWLKNVILPHVEGLTRTLG